MIDLRLGDCLDILPTLADKSVDAVITDPPYGTKIGKMNFTNNRHGGVALRNDYKGGADWDSEPMSEAQYIEIVRVAKTLVFFGGNFFDYLPVSRGWYVWDKKNGGQFSNDFADCEMAWTNRDMPSRIIRHIWHGMIQQDMSNKEKRYHPSQKPVPVMERIIEDLTQPGDTILDPFMGSGTTGVACVKLGRNFIGIEREPKYYDIAARRIHEAQQQMVMPL
jgi:site-specific DNA-methyltransferase (adenine-specific)